MIKPLNMKTSVRVRRALLTLAVITVIFGSCRRSGRPTSVDPGAQSSATGLAFNEDSSFSVRPFDGQPEGPNLVFIEGGRMTLGSFEEDILVARDNLERTVTVASFYMDETEVANIHWLEYQFYIQDSTQEYQDAANPDQEVWRSRLAYNDPYVEQYLKYPGFRYFPVVGVSWVQAIAYAEWRTAAVNQGYEQEAIASGVWDPDLMADAESDGRIPIESGIVLPNYRLPSESEWEYAAQALIGTQWLDENQTHQRLYPWDGHALRNPYGKEMGYFLANFKRGRGDYAGISGKLNDGAMITAYIYEYPPNDYGLYNMAGNVNEWVMDLYRPLSFQDMEDLNPMRRDDFLDKADNYDPLTQLISNSTRVYKGGSWKDVAYWMSPGTRRYLDQDSATATIGFRCAMIRAGSNY
jgi:gliding motility-associated lipoprotein GldJ